MTSPRSLKDREDDRKVLRWPIEAPESTKGVRLSWDSVRQAIPGLLTGAANADPSLVLTAIVVGATFHFATLWVVLLCVPFLWAIFAVAARLGFETRHGMMDLLRSRYGRKVAIIGALILIVINMAMITADLMAVSEAMSMVLGQSRLFFVVAVAFSVWYTLIFQDYRAVARVLLWFSLPLFVYVIAALVQSPSPQAVLLGSVLPRVATTSDYARAVIGLFGSLLTPYVFIWQTASQRETVTLGGLKPNRIEAYAGTVLSALLSYCAIVSAGSILHLPNAWNMTMAQAAETLRPTFGASGTILFCVGIIGSGLVALPVLIASMCYSVSEAMDWKSGFSERTWDAGRFYSLISGAVFIAAVASVFLHNPVRVLYWSQVLAGVLTAPLLLAILVLANDPKLVKTTNSRAQNFFIGAAIGALLAAEMMWVWKATHGG